MTNLTLTHLRLDCTAETTIYFHPHKAGNALRNALANTMRRATCTAPHNQAIPDPAHAAVCPVCYLLAANTEPGRVRRGYAVIPPLHPNPTTHIKEGEPFAFGLTLFGDAFQYLPYFLLAVEATGRTGVGMGRGSFRLDAVSAHDPLTGRQELLLAPGEQLVHIPQIQTRWSAVAPHVSAALNHLTTRDHELTIHFLTPTRIVERQKPYKSPDFRAFFGRTLMRIDQLGQQFSDDERRPSIDVQRLHEAAAQVRLVESQVQWQELWSQSSRKGKGHDTPLGGFVGHATYWAADWEPLLPWLVWAQAVQAGKEVTKGNGVFALGLDAKADYWSWLKEPLAAVANRPCF